MRNLIGALGENYWAQLTMNSSASSSRSFSMKGEGSIELKSWFMSRSFRLMVCGCPRSVAVVSDNEKRIRKSLLSSGSSNIGSAHQGVVPGFLSRQKFPRGLDVSLLHRIVRPSQSPPAF